jgi:hypothetical protein
LASRAGAGQPAGAGRGRRADQAGGQGRAPGDSRHSNKQIAAKLSLTVRTVEFHLSGVYRELGISGRRELSAVLATLL